MDIDFVTECKIESSTADVIKQVNKKVKFEIFIADQKATTCI